MVVVAFCATRLVVVALIAVNPVMLATEALKVVATALMMVAKPAWMPLAESPVNDEVAVVSVAVMTGATIPPAEDTLATLNELAVRVPPTERLPVNAEFPPTDRLLESVVLPRTESVPLMVAEARDAGPVLVREDADMFVLEILPPEIEGAAIDVLVS